MEIGRSVMTTEELREYCEATGQSIPAPRRRGPRARLSLDLGDERGRAVISVECDPSHRQAWRDWLMARMDKLGGTLIDR